MKIHVDPHQLADAAGWVAKNLPARVSVPVLSGVLLRAAGGRLTVSGFDYEVSTEAAVEVQAGGEDGAALVSAKLLAEITKALPAKPVDISTAGTHLELVCGSARFTLPTMPVEDYPALPDMPGPAGTIDAATFATAVGQVAIAAGRDETLPMMTGVRVEFNGPTIAMLATDRYRLALREIPWQPDAANVQADALVPARTIADTAKMLGQAGGTVAINLGQSGQGEGSIGFTTDSRRLTSRLLDGANYPPVRSLFPADDQVTAEARIPVAALSEVVKRVSLVGNRTTPVLLTFDSDGSLVVEAGGTEDARASEAMDATFTGGQLTIAFNPQYLLDGIGSLNTPTALFRFVDAFKPAVLLPAPADGGESDGSHKHLLMPIRATR